MPEAVIVAAARSPIGRAGKGSLVSARPDVGHPLGMTGARIATTLINSLRTRDKQLCLETTCVGGGQGMAMVREASTSPAGPSADGHRTIDEGSTCARLQRHR